MRHIMAIYDVDPLYAARFADVVNQTEKIPFDVLAFSSFDKLKKFAKENPVELLLISSAVSREEAEDAVQETALEAFRGLHGLRQPDAFRGWMFTILSARCNRHIRGLIRRREETDLDACPLACPDFAGDRDTALRLRAAIADLGPEDRRLVLLSVVGGYSGKEIAALLGRPEGTLRSRLHRTLKKLRALLPEEEPANTP